MKNKIIGAVYLTVCFLMCLIPSVGMTIARTDHTTENRQMAKLPKLKKDGKMNITYLQELGAWFEDHFAFRNVLVTADSNIQVKVFSVSNMDSVITGKNGWMYYTDTLYDFLGENTMSDRELFNVTNNLSLMQRYVQERGAKFLFTVAPNKNSLYGENMPYYYSKKVSKTKNISLLTPQLEKMQISYADLFSPFQQQDEILYLKRDSHWNNKGAVLAYNTILDRLKKPHETYESVPSLRKKEEIGDLNSMVYPLGAEPEWNDTYQKQTNYHYVNQVSSVEDAWIETENSKGKGYVLMFRDSFGNTLLPLFADTYEKGYFSKGIPYQIETYMNQYQPDTVIVEKVERNLDELATQPPLMAGPEVTEKIEVQTKKTKTTLSLAESENDTSFWKVEGQIDSSSIADDSKIFIRFTEDGISRTYEAFTVTKDGNDDGFLLYLPKDEIQKDSVTLEVIVKTNDHYNTVKSMQAETKK